MKEFRKLFGLFLFISLMLVKVSALHVYSHQDDDSDSIENCSVCEIAIENQLTDFHEADTIKIPSTNIIVSHIVNLCVKWQTPKQQFAYHLFSRPPPSVV